MGAKKTVDYNGVKFDNIFEKDFYVFLEKQGIKFTYHKKINLIPKSEFGKPVDWNLDFYLEELEIYIDIKGLNKTETYEKLKKRLFRERYGDRVYFVAEAPKWYQKGFGKVWVEYEVKRKIETVVKRYKDSIKLFTITKDGKKKYGMIKESLHGKDLIELCKEKKLLPFSVWNTN